MLRVVMGSCRSFAGLVALSFALSGCGLGEWFAETRSSFVPPEPDGVLARLSGLSRTPDGEVHHFALLIGADTELRHRGNLSMAYQVLLEQGYRREDIFILDSEGSTPFFPNVDVTTRGSLTALLGYLADVADADDTLLVYVTGHGRRIEADRVDSDGRAKLGVSTIVLNRAEELSQDEFIERLERIHVGVGIAFFDQCYFGQVPGDRLCNWITITTALEDETSHGVSFPRAFWAAFRARPAAEARLTVFDAFKWAMVEDVATRLGQNRPRIAYACVNPANILLTGVSRSAVDKDLEKEGERKKGRGSTAARD